MIVIRKIIAGIAFIIFYLRKLIQANVYIAYDIITPKMHTNPGYLWVPLRTTSNLGLLLFSNLVSMTPGTLSIDVSKDQRSLLVHYLYADNKNDVLEEIEKIQSKIIKLTN